MDASNLQMKNNFEILPDKEYQWNNSWRSRIAHTDISKVIEELRIIHEVNGELSPEQVVESSKNKKSILHSYFEWDNEKAASKWRIRQAIQLLSHIEVKIISNGEPKVYKVFEMTKRGSTGESHQYKTFDTITPENIDFIKQFAVTNLKKTRNKLFSFGFTEAVKHIDAAIESLSKESTETTEVKSKVAETAAA